MKNLDIIIFTGVVVVAFIIFLVYSIKEFIKVLKKDSSLEESGPRAELIKLVGKVFDSPMTTKDELVKKKAVYRAITRTISDMESEGLYFPDDIKQELVKRREELNCEYSGLPSVKAYE